MKYCLNRACMVQPLIDQLIIRSPTLAKKATYEVYDLLRKQNFHSSDIENEGTT